MTGTKTRLTWFLGGDAEPTLGQGEKLLLGTAVTPVEVAAADGTLHRRSQQL